MTRTTKVQVSQVRRPNPHTTYQVTLPKDVVQYLQLRGREQMRFKRMPHRLAVELTIDQTEGRR